MTLDVPAYTDWLVFHVICWQMYVIPDSKVMRPTWGQSEADRTQVGPMLAPWTSLSGMVHIHRAKLRLNTIVYVYVTSCMPSHVPHIHKRYTSFAIILSADVLSPIPRTELATKKITHVFLRMKYLGFWFPEIYIPDNRFFSKIAYKLHLFRYAIRFVTPCTDKLNHSF